MGRIADRIGHPLFARMYRRLAAASEKAGAADHRQRMLQDLKGEVVEVGAGHGLNFRHYPEGVQRVLAVEPEAHLRGHATASAARAAVDIEVVEGDADHLPVADGSVDAVVFSLVLCSVPDPARTLAEARRVLKQGGQIRFYEHVAADNAKWLRMQLRMEPFWKVIGGGCNLTRRTEDAIVAAGFHVDTCERFLFQPSITFRPAAPHILGSATRT